MTNLFYGTVVAESLTDPKILDEFDVISKEVSDEPALHLYKVRGTRAHIRRLRIFLKEGKWYMHFWRDDNIVVVFKDEIFEFKQSDIRKRQLAIEYGISLGIPQEQLDFPTG